MNGNSTDLTFKEIITALLALAIMAIMLIFLWHAFWYTSGTNKLSEDQKYLLGIALSLAGTVTGYYFGRVPAEKRAESAEKSEKIAKNAEATSNAKLMDTRKTVQRLLVDEAVSKEAVDISRDPQNSAVVRQALEDLLDRLN